MAQGSFRSLRREEQVSDDDEDENRSLLSSNPSEVSDLVVHDASTHIYKAGDEPRSPGTPNRVRVQFDNHSPAPPNGHAQSADSTWTEDEDYLAHNAAGGRRDSAGHRFPLLTDIEAPSITVASADLGFSANDLLESARPKSGMRSAFMNMANSIIGAGIIGQPYAFKQAGLATGVILLVLLTITVDWTINLIVVNSKLSGSNSFQSTMEYCFGRPGLIAISVSHHGCSLVRIDRPRLTIPINRSLNGPCTWSEFLTWQSYPLTAITSAFGGMVAFCIIVGDTIPHVMTALFPSLSNVPVLWLLTNRRAVIVMFILGVSYPLSLYRDIAKVWTRSPRVNASY